MENTTPQEPVKAVFPSDFEIVKNILDQYQSHLEEATKKAEDAIEKLRRNLRNAEDANIGIIAQKKLIETLSRDFKRSSPIKPE